MKKELARRDSMITRLIQQSKYNYLYILILVPPILVWVWPLLSRCMYILILFPPILVGVWQLLSRYMYILILVPPILVWVWPLLSKYNYILILVPPIPVWDGWFWPPLSSIFPCVIRWLAPYDHIWTLWYVPSHTIMTCSITPWQVDNGISGYLLT